MTYWYISIIAYPLPTFQGHEESPSSGYTRWSNYLPLIKIPTSWCCSNVSSLYWPGDERSRVMSLPFRPKSYLIRLENFVSHEPRVLHVPFEKLLVNFNETLTEQWLLSGHSTRLVNLLEGSPVCTSAWSLGSWSLSRIRLLFPHCSVWPGSPLWEHSWRSHTSFI